jgi:hypothetical protein
MAILQEEMTEEFHAKARKGRAATNGRATLGRTTLLRDVYRSLINSGRTYAAFRDEDRSTVARLVDRSPVLDPMSGYGGLARLCAELGIESFGIEYNPAQYFWQLLSHPARTDMHLRAIATLLVQRRNWPRSRQRAVVADEFFPDDTLALVERLFTLIQTTVAELPASVAKPWEVTASLLLPFSGRLACTSPGDVSTHTKEGGTCVLLGWQDDFCSYLDALRSHLERIRDRSKCINHDVILGDARSVDLGNRRFRSMFTSPPYPNHRDFSSILLPENTLLNLIGSSNGFDVPFVREGIIGSNFVKGAKLRCPTSPVANSFMAEALTVHRNKRAEYDDEVYYIPYFRNYFCSLETAYQHVARYLHASFEGYVVIVNNTHRGIVIPVSEVVQDIWQSLGFRTEVFHTMESSHLGAKNPRAKGMRALHTEYVVRIWR